MSEIEVLDRVALYGGSFDPPHNGHIATVALLLNSLLVDRVIVVPSGERPDKTKATPAIDRLTMTRLAVEEAFPNDKRVCVSDVQALAKAGYGMIDLLDCMCAHEPQAKFQIVIGSELVSDLPRWRERGRLAASANFLVVERPGGALFNAPEGFRLQRVPNSDHCGVLVSSTQLRGMISKGESCAGFVPAAVISFIRQRSLYFSFKS